MHSSHGATRSPSYATTHRGLQRGPSRIPAAVITRRQIEDGSYLRHRGSRIWPWMLLAAIGAGTALYFHLTGWPPALTSMFDGGEARPAVARAPVAPPVATEPDRAAAPMASEPAPSSLVEGGSEVPRATGHPLPEVADAAPSRPLPPIERSDPVIQKALSAAFPKAGLMRYLNMQDHVQRLVTTVDNLPREIVPRQLSAVQPIKGRMVIERQGERMTLDATNSARYDGYVSFVESLDPQALVRLYVRFHPMLEAEYRQQGGKGRFHDRVVAAIDDMLAAPTLTGPVELVQPKVLYRYADPDIERLSAGRKIMIRIGPDNQARMRTVLRRWRARLIGQPLPDEGAGNEAPRKAAPR